MLLLLLLFLRVPPLFVQGTRRRRFLAGIKSSINVYNNIYKTSTGDFIFTVLFTQ